MTGIGCAKAYASEQAKSNRRAVPAAAKPKVNGTHLSPVSEIFKRKERRYGGRYPKEPEMAIRPICPSSQHCANREVRISLLENEVARLQGLDAIREDVANLLQEEIAELTRKLRAMEEAMKSDQFRRAKIVISKALHPNNFEGGSADDAGRHIQRSLAGN